MPSAWSLKRLHPHITTVFGSFLRPHRPIFPEGSALNLCLLQPSPLLFSQFSLYPPHLWTAQNKKWRSLCHPDADSRQRFSAGNNPYNTGSLSPDITALSSDPLRSPPNFPHRKYALFWHLRSALLSLLDRYGNTLEHFFHHGDCSGYHLARNTLHGILRFELIPVKHPFCIFLF